MKTCPKCGYTRRPEDQAPEWQCPSCGVAYNKVAPQAREQPHQAAATSSGKRPLIVVGTLCVGVLAGWFGHQAYVVHQVSAAFGKAAELVSGAARSARAEPQETPVAEGPETAPEPAPKTTPLEVSLVAKGWRDADYVGGRGGDAITFGLEFFNGFEKDVEAFEGVVVFSDKLGNRVMGVHVVIDDPIAQFKRMRWDGELKYNQFKDSHRQLRTKPADKLQVRFEPSRVLFADGEARAF